jgi:hypothetical protein
LSEVGGASGTVVGLSIGLSIATGIGLACASGQAFQCTGDASCGLTGSCEANGYCAFPDTTCPSGRRYGEFSGSFAGTCVEEATTEQDATTADAASESAVTVSTSGSETTTLPLDDTGSSTAMETTTSPSTSGSTTDLESTTDSGSVDIGPLPIENDFDDGAIYAAMNEQTWLPSGEAELGGFLGEYPLGEPYYGYFRFALPRGIPSGATIEAMTLSLTGHATYNWSVDEDALVVALELSADAPQVAAFDAFPPLGETKLGEQLVRWPGSGGLDWDVSGVNDSPDLSPLLQELVAEVGPLEAGSHIQLWLRKETLGMLNSEVGYVDFAFDEAAVATLQITFSAG